MSYFKNCRPSLLGLPDGTFVMPGAVFEMAREGLKNPSMKKWLKAGYFKPCPAPEPEDVTAVTLPTDTKADHIAKIAAADVAGLLALAEGESDPEIMDAIVARAKQLETPPQAT